MPIPMEFLCKRIRDSFGKITRVLCYFPDTSYDGCIYRVGEGNNTWYLGQFLYLYYVCFFYRRSSAANDTLLELGGILWRLGIVLGSRIPWFSSAFDLTNGILLSMSVMSKDRLYCCQFLAALRWYTTSYILYIYVIYMHMSCWN